MKLTKGVVQNWVVLASGHRCTTIFQFVYNALPTEIAIDPLTESTFH